jgi:hypothetical protein
VPGTWAWPVGTGGRSACGNANSGVCGLFRPGAVPSGHVRGQAPGVAGRDTLWIGAEARRRLRRAAAADLRALGAERRVGERLQRLVEAP